MREKTAEAVQDQLYKGLIEPEASKWASSVVLVPKIDFSLRLCVDYRSLNETKVAETFHLSRMDDCIDILGGSFVLSKLNTN